MGLWTLKLTELYLYNVPPTMAHDFSSAIIFDHWETSLVSPLLLSVVCGSLNCNEHSGFISP
jgi:hypothetical protein